MTYEIARTLVRGDPDYATAIALVRHIVAKVYSNPDDQAVIADLVVSALACAYVEGYVHKEGMQ